MIVCEHEQGTPEWHKDRLGIPSASMFSSIITSAGKPSTSAKTYMNQLLADWYVGHPVDPWPGNKFTEDGKDREPEIRQLYEFLTDMEVQEIGFCYKDEKKLVGCSPDGLVGDDGLVEFKNPKGSTMIKYLLSGDKVPSEYVAQVQGQMWITGRQWCDFMFHHPDIGHKIIHVERDEKYITTMSGLVSKFINEMLEKRKILEKIK